VLVEGANPDQDVHEATLKLDAKSTWGRSTGGVPPRLIAPTGQRRADDGRFELSEFEAELVTTDAEGKTREPQILKFAHSGGDAWDGERSTTAPLTANRNQPGDPDPTPSTAACGGVFWRTDEGRAEFRTPRSLHYQASKSKRALGIFAWRRRRTKFVGSHNTGPARPVHVLGPFKCESLERAWPTHTLRRRNRAGQILSRRARRDYDGIPGLNSRTGNRTYC